MDGFLNDIVKPVEENLSEQEREAFRQYLAQFDHIAHELVRHLEPDRRDALCEQVVAMGIFALHDAGELVPEPVVDFVNLIFNRCNIRVTDDRKVP